MYCPDTNINYTADATVHFLEEGKEYYINNKAYNNANISVETNGSLGTSGDQALLKAFEVATGSQRYTFTMNPLDGYVYIRNVDNGLYLGVENNSTSDGAFLKQYSLNSSSNGQQFKIVKSGDYVKLLPKTGGDTKGLASEPNIVRPRMIQQKTLSNGDMFLWEIREHVATVRIEVLLDEGFRNRYSNYQQQVQILMTPVINTFMNRFDIRVVYDITNYTSCADACPRPYDLLCDCVPNSDCNNSILSNMHHKNQYHLFQNLWLPAVFDNRVGMLDRSYRCRPTW